MDTARQGSGRADPQRMTTDGPWISSGTSVRRATVWGGVLLKTPGPLGALPV